MCIELRSEANLLVPATQAGQTIGHSLYSDPVAEIVPWRLMCAPLVVARPLLAGFRTGGL